MPKIKVELSKEVIDGQPITFVAPCDCSDATGLKVSYPGGAKEFVFKDSHGNALTGITELFLKDAYVRVIVDTVNGNAFIQNADTNAYLEAQLASKAPASHTEDKNNPHGVTAAQVGAAKAGLHRCYGSLKDIGINTFPTTMEAVATAMPANSMIVIDTRTIMSGGAEEISDWGNTSNGTAYINKGTSIARVTMAVIYGSGSAVKGRLFVGSWANSDNTVGWCDYGFDGNASYPGCFYRSVDGVTEWINPPALVGVEYRTTERRGGKVVYTKMIGCGTIPATGRTVTAHNLDCRIVRYAGAMSSNLSLPYRDPLASNGVGNGTIDLAISGNNITIVSNMTDGQSPGTAYVQLWYVKD